jgi:group I intron endonuclease
MQFLFYDAKNKGGIYKIINTISGKVYIGSTKKFSKRANSHYNSLNKKIHFNSHLQKSFNKYGKDNFVFEVIEIVVGDKLTRTMLEQEYINEYFDSWEQCFNFNKNVIQNEVDFEHISFTQSEIKKSFYQTEAGQKLIQKLSDEKRGKTYEEMYGESRAVEIKQTIRDNKLIEMNRPEVKENLRKQLTGVSFEERFGTERAKEIKEKRSKSRKGKYTGKNSSGFRIIENIILLSPDGEIYTRIEGIGDFAEAHGLRKNHFSELLSGKRKSHRGWILM